MDSLYKISITCFAASYLVVFAFELARVFFRSELLQTKIARYLKTGFAVSGFFAHTIYLVFHGGLTFDSHGLSLGNWFGWCLAASWLLACAYLWISFRRSESVFGLFLLPVVMLLIWIGSQFGDSPAFSASHARSGWNMIHGASLLVGTAVVALGCIFGIVYLIQAYRLKHKLPQSKWFRLPSLEWLQQSSERALVTSALLLGVGLISGIAINQFSSPAGEGSERSISIAWSDPVVWSSGILFAWLLAATIFNLFYRPARQGKKVAYLVVTSFLFLILELGIVWWFGHAIQTAAVTRDTSHRGNAQVNVLFSANTQSIAGARIWHCDASPRNGWGEPV